MTRRITFHIIHLIIATAVLMTACLLSGKAHAEDIPFDLSASRYTGQLGQSIQLNLQFSDRRDIPAVDIPEINGFSSRYVGPSTSMSFVNGKMSSSITHIYRLVPLKTGTFDIGPLSFSHDGSTYRSNRITITIADRDHGQPSSPGRQPESTTHLKDRLFLSMKTPKKSVYINEIVPLEVKLHVSGLRVRDIQYPEYIHEGFSVERPDEPRQYKEQRAGRLYNVVDFSTSLFATKSGTFTLGPASIEANLLVERDSRRRSSPFGRDPFDDFFGRQRTEPVQIESEPLTLEVLPLPQAGRPSGFSGAVGQFNFSAEVSPDRVKAGDPLTVTMTVTGKGNFNTVTAPAYKESDHFKTYEPQGRQEEGKKVFEQVIIPLDASVNELPALTFSFFDTDKGMYRTLSRGPFPVTVMEPEKSEELTILEAPRQSAVPLMKEQFGRDIIYIKESPGSLKKKGRPLHSNPAFLLLNLLPALALAVSFIIKKRKEKLSSDTGYARRVAAPKEAKKGIHNAERQLEQQNIEGFYDTVFITLKAYIGNRFHVPAAGITEVTADYVLKKSGIDEDTRKKVQRVFNECDMARYASSGMGSSSMNHTLENLKEVIEKMEKQK